MRNLIATPIWIAALIAGFAIVGFGLAILHITEISHRSKGGQHALR